MLKMPRLNVTMQALDLFCLSPKNAQWFPKSLRVYHATLQMSHVTVLPPRPSITCSQTPDPDAPSLQNTTYAFNKEPGENEVHSRVLRRKKGRASDFFFFRTQRTWTFITTDSDIHLLSFYLYQNWTKVIFNEARTHCYIKASPKIQRIFVRLFLSHSIKK